MIYGTPVRVSASGVICRGNGCLVGVLCNSSTAGTVTLYDDTNGATTAFAAAIPMVAGAYTPIPAAFANGLYFVLGGTADVTFFVGN